tara:strand:- start:677 stop:1522 length:846 start_codon:yes stop_codon:yes gene_type:complete
MTVDKLLKLLDDPVIINKITSLCSDLIKVNNAQAEVNSDMGLDVMDDAFLQEKHALEEKNMALNKEKDEMLKRIKDLLDQILGKDKELSNNAGKMQELGLQVKILKQSLEIKEVEVNKLTQEINCVKKRLDTTDKKANWYRDNFSDDIKIQAIYNDLTDVTKESLSGIFKTTTLSGLIACGIQEKNIGNLWDYTKNEVVNNTNPDTTSLIQLFDILFSRFRLAFPMYELQSVAEEDEFDTQLHLKHSSSTSASGVIDRIMLLGYLNVKTGKVVKQSIVKIR